MPVHKAEQSAPRWHFSEEEIVQLTQTSLQEALALARTLLKQWWLEAILEQVGQQFQPTSAPSKTSQSEAQVYYVYGVTWAGRSVQSTEALESIPFRKVQALVQRVPAAEYGLEAIRQRLQDTEWLHVQLRKHHQVLASLQLEGPLLPLRFGTICPERTHVQTLLEANYEDFCATLTLLQGREEWLFQLEVDQTRLRETVALVQNTTVDDPLLDAEVDRLLQIAAEHCHQTLSAQADRARVQHLNVRNPSILRAAYLVRSEHSEAFRDRVATLERAYRTLGIRLRLEGPSPPFNFARLRLDEPAAVPA